MPKTYFKSICSCTIPLIAILYLTSCSTSYYAPSPHNVPLLNQRDEVSASVSASFYPRAISTNVQTAYSPRENLGLMVNASFFEMHKDDSTGEQFGLKGNFIEAATGYYTDMGGDFVFDTYLGYGYLFNGSSTHIRESPETHFNYHRIFLQPSLGYKHEIFDLVFSFRFSQLLYRNITNDSIPESNSVWEHGYLVKNENFTMLEPAITLRVGYRYLKFQVQLGSALNFSPRDFSYDPISLSMGMVFNFRPNYLGPRPQGLD